MALLRAITAREQAQFSLALSPEQANDALRSKVAESPHVGGVISDSLLVLYERGMGIGLPGWGLVFEGSLQRQGSGSRVAGFVRWGHVARFAFAVWFSGIALVILSTALGAFSEIQHGHVPVFHVTGLLFFVAFALLGFFILDRWRRLATDRLVTRLRKEVESDVAAV